MKKALKLLVDKFDSHIHKKMKLLVKEEFQNEFEVKVQEIKDVLQNTNVANAQQKKPRSKSKVV